MKIRKLLLAATSLGAGVLCVPGMLPQAMAQDASAEPQTIETIVVSGIRGSIAASAAIKRDSHQIVDVVTAEDVGKLPDNNVPEALAHVTGVQIERVHGEGSSVSIRGMTNVSTTLNGNSASVGESRSMNLADIPAELLKSVQVYKSRSADQVEGGIAGTVNVDLRRPLDLPKGWTLAGSVRAVNASIGDTWSPYLSALVADRFDTGIGEMGFLLNVSYTQNSFNENYFYNESPQVYWGATGKSQFAVNTIVPYASYFGTEVGVNTRPSVNLSTQWRVNDNLDFVLEGTYISSKNKIHRDRLKLVNDGDSYSLSNVTYMPQTTPYGPMVKSFKISNGTSVVNGGPESYFETNNSDEFNTNAEAHWHSGRLAVDSSVQYNWSAFKYHGILSLMRFNNATSATVDFASSDAGGGPKITYGSEDLSSASGYDLFQYHDERLVAKSQELDTQTDVTYRVSDDWYLRSLKVGGRYTDRHTTRNFGYRDAFFFQDNTTTWSKYLPIANLPNCGNKLDKVQPDMAGSPSWYRISPQCLVNNEAALRQFIIAGGAAGTVDTQGRDWTTAQPPDVDLQMSYKSDEFSMAGYAKAVWGFTALFPVDGEVGARVVNTWGDVTSTDYKTYHVTTPTDYWYTTASPHTAHKNYTDVMPSANAIMHFTDKFQGRLSYSYQIERPQFLDSSAWEVIDNPGKNIWAGNPDLKPMREHNYEATLEYFFGKGGQLSLNYFLKKPHGWNYYDGVLISDVADPYFGYTRWTNRNAAPGTFEGLEFTAQTFFDFLPGIWSNFGASANATLMTSYKIGYTYLKDVTGIPNVYAAAGTSRYTYNLALYYDTPELSARLAYNFRAAWRSGIYLDLPGLSPWNDPTSRLDAAVNYTPYKWVTFSLEGANLLEETNHSYWGKEKYLPESTRMQARTIQLSARFRY